MQAMAPADRADPGQAADDPQALMAAAIDWIAREADLGQVQAVGHRVVMGGTEFAAPVRIDAPVLARLEAMTPLAPLHQPACIAGVRASVTRLPHLPQVACFDTAFIGVSPGTAARQFHDEGVRRFGFHGLSYAHLAHRLDRVAPGLARGRVHRRASPWATARRCAHFRRRDRSPPPWASRRSTACRWARAAARSIPVSCCG
jgi:acetate kinase